MCVEANVYLSPGNTFLYECRWLCAVRTCPFDQIYTLFDAKFTNLEIHWFSTANWVHENDLIKSILPHNQTHIHADTQAQALVCSLTFTIIWVTICTDAVCIHFLFLFVRPVFPLYHRNFAFIPFEFCGKCIQSDCMGYTLYYTRMWARDRSIYSLSMFEFCSLCVFVCGCVACISRSMNENSSEQRPIVIRLNWCAACGSAPNSLFQSPNFIETHIFLCEKYCVLFTFIEWSQSREIIHSQWSRWVRGKVVCMSRDVDDGTDRLPEFRRVK